MKKNNVDKSCPMVLLPFSPYRKIIGLPRITHMPGTIVHFKKHPHLVAYNSNYVLFHRSEGIIQADSLCMHPTIQSFYYIGVKRERYKEYIPWGYIYLVFDRSNWSFLCTIHPSRENSIKLVFKNKQFPAIIMKYSEIWAVFRVYNAMFDL